LSLSNEALGFDNIPSEMLGHSEAYQNDAYAMAIPDIRHHRETLVIERHRFIQVIRVPRDVAERYE
jgi:hypothetical protein